MNLWRLPNIIIAPESLFGTGWLTNTLLCAWISSIVLLIVLFLGMRRSDMIPSGLQNGIEWIMEALLGLVESVSGKEKGRKFFPIVISFFLFILACNLLDVFPGVDTIGSIHGTLKSAPVAGFLLFGDDSNKIVPWLRPATTDLNLTLALALVSVVVTQGFGFYMLGAKGQIGKYLNFKSGPVQVIVGLLEIITETGRLISFSFRLFGNVFAGGVLLAVFAFLVPVIATAVFIPLELFVGAIQAFVFAFLTLLFLELGTISHDHEDHRADEHGSGDEFEASHSEPIQAAY